MNAAWKHWCLVATELSEALIPWEHQSPLEIRRNFWPLAQTTAVRSEERIKTLFSLPSDNRVIEPIMCEPFVALDARVP